MPKPTSSIDYPSLEDFEPYREFSEKMKQLESQELDLKTAEEKLVAEINAQLDKRLSGENQPSFDEVDAALAGNHSAVTQETADQVALSNVRERLAVVRRALEGGRLELNRRTNAASNELLPPLKERCLNKWRRVVLAVCELSEANEDLWKVGDELTNRGFAWQHILPVGKMFHRARLQLGTSTSFASSYLVDAVRSGVVSVVEVKKFSRTPFLMELLLAAENEFNQTKKSHETE